MNFSGHFGGGLLAASGMVVVGLLTGELALPALGSGEAVFSQGVIQVGVVFALTLFMALFPDLDTASIPQRWFFRFTFVLLAGLLVAKLYTWFVGVTFFALAPVLHKHRGWTHWKVTPWLLAGFIGVVVEYMRAEDAWFGRFSLEMVGESLVSHWFLIAAMVVGHYTHLLLDNPLGKWVPFVANKPGHH